MTEYYAAVKMNKAKSCVSTKKMLCFSHHGGKYHANHGILLLRKVILITFWIHNIVTRYKSNGSSVLVSWGKFVADSLHFKKTLKHILLVLHALSEKAIKIANTVQGAVGNRNMQVIVSLLHRSNSSKGILLPGQFCGNRNMYSNYGCHGEKAN